MSLLKLTIRDLYKFHHDAEVQFVASFSQEYSENSWQFQCGRSARELRRRKAGPQESKEQRTMTAKNAMRLRSPTAKELQQAMTVIIRIVQRDSFSSELNFKHLVSAYPVKGSHKEHGVVCVMPHAAGLRGEASYVTPKDHHVANLVVRHYHSQVHHQGHQITHGAIHQAG